MRDMEMKMGYYSDVGIVVVFECEEHADEVMDVYQTVTMRDEEQCHEEEKKCPNA
jgi:hypothetical protein